MTARKAPDGRQARWDTHNRARRQAIVEAAVEVIGELPPGEDVHVQQIAERAGLSRTVVYRHFGERADLDGAIQAAVLDELRAEIVPAISLEGPPRAIIHRIVTAYVGWAAAHRSLHRFAERDLSSDGTSAMDAAVGQIAAQVQDLIALAVDVLPVELEDGAREGLDPLVFGLVGGAVAAVRRWLGRPVLTPSTEVFVDLVTEAIWAQIAGMVAARGLALDPDVPVQDVVAESLTEGAR